MRNLRNDPLWDELLYWLENPITEEEQQARDNQEKAYQESVLNRMYGDDSTETATGGAAPVDYTKLYQDIQNNKSLSQDEKVNQIKNLSAARNKEIDWQHAKKMGQYYGGAGLEIASMFIPGMAGAKVANAGLKLSKPLINQIVKKELTKGAIEGAASSGVYGLGRGMLEDKKPLLTAAQDTAEGALTGLGLGAIAGGIHASKPSIQNLDKTLDKRKDWGIAYRKQSGNPEGAINKLLEEQQGFVPDAFHKEGIGDVDLVWGKQNYKTGKGYGLEHIIDGRTRKNNIDGVAYAKSLPEKFENSQLLQKEGLNILQHNNDTIVLPSSWNGKSRNWMLTAYPKYEPTVKHLSSFSPETNISSKNGSNSISELSVGNSIIPNDQPNLKSWSEWLEELRRKRGH